MTNHERVFVSYAMSRSIPEITPVQARKLTHVNIAFANLDGDQLIIKPAMRESLYYLQQLRRYNPNLNILLSTGGGGDSFMTAQHGFATKPENIKAFVASSMALIREFSFDGIDCDWEYPRDATERAQHAELMLLYREGLDKIAAERGRKCWLTAAVSCGELADRIDYAKIMHCMDYFNLMTYDFRWESELTGHHSNPASPKEGDQISVHSAIKLFRERNVPNHMLVVGGAFYSHRYDGVQGGGDGLNKPYSKYSYGPDYTSVYHQYEGGAEYTKYWDDVAQAPYLFNGSSFITYDDPMSIRIKAEIVRQEGLRGMMFWEHGGDKTGRLFDAIYDHLMV